MNIAVVYFSKTGNSKKIAEALAGAFQTKALNITEKPVLENVDLLFITGAIYGGVSSPEMREYAETLSSNSVKKAVLITSCLRNKQKQNDIRAILEAKNITTAAEEFLCRGRLLFIGLGHPSKSDISNAVAFAKKIAAEK